MQENRIFTALNAGYVAELYERYRRDPLSVDPATRAIFQEWSPEEQVTAQPPAPAAVEGFLLEKAIQAVKYASAIRSFGHLAASIYPVGGRPLGDPALNLETYGLAESDLTQLPASVVGGPSCEEKTNALESIRALQSIYEDGVGYDYSQVEDPAERQWLRFAAECGRFRAGQSLVDEAKLLDRLTQVEVFETFLNRFFTGKTRFSIEGLDMLVPMLDELVRLSVDNGVCMVLFGMAHRGRLNILAHLLSKPYAQILSEFKDPLGSETWENEIGWTGDVKYHKGAYRSVPGGAKGEEVKVVLYMPPNPSHLEFINPVVKGLARAAQSGVNQPGAPAFYPDAAVPILIHGDAAFPGEGIVAETMNFMSVPGYETAGTVHIISNNQLGFTALPTEGRSTLYASDLAKGFKIPIIHVNADDPLGCIEAIRTAVAYRQEFHKDFMIDMIGYRRAGHNEGDEPSFTQPVLYEEIRSHPTVRAILAEKLVKAGRVDSDLPGQWVQRYQNDLQNILENLNPEEEMDETRQEETPSAESVPDTSLPVDRLREMGRELRVLPDGFELHPRLRRVIERRGTSLDEAGQKTIDWGAAEELAFASILADGVAVRLTGQDVERGTFSHRHAVLFDYRTGSPYIPLQHLPQAKASFEVRNSPLSESAALAFEYGYNIFDPRRLVLWEAQYGDFINVAQAIVDEFIVSGKSKWDENSSLVMLLPHAYEGQGPDHSSGRIERFLNLAVSGNMRIANCTTSAQYYHLLREQAILSAQWPRPLVIFTPKSLLRHPRVASSLEDLAQGRWQPVLDDPTLSGPPERVERLLFCSGKIAIDLMESSLRAENPRVALIRIEQLYPFPEREVSDICSKYSHASEYIWVQEEPENMGPWQFVRPLLNNLLGNVSYVGRAPGASPAEGSMSWHTANQTALIGRAFVSSGQDRVEEEERDGNQDRRAEFRGIRH